MPRAKILDAVQPLNAARAIDEAAELLRRGELVAFPTETVYGLGADAFNPAAIGNVFSAKGRPADNPLIVHLATAGEIERCGIVDRRVERLAVELMPGPLTLVIESKASVPEIARAGMRTVAVRIPDHPVALALLARSGPLVAPSANLSGRPSPTTACHVLDDLGGRIPAILDGGPCRIGIESTVLDLSGEQAAILRPGMIEPERIEEVIGERVSKRTAAGDAPKAPGMKYRHYAPAAPIRLVIGEALPEGLGIDDRVMIVTTRRHIDRFPYPLVRLLNEELLYATLREADELGVRGIVVFAAPGDLSAGLLDRISKAAERVEGSE